MREKLSRGKRLDNGEWVIGYYVRLSGPRSYICTGYAEGDSVEAHEVDPETVGRFTGTQDLSDVDVVEDDIVKVYYMTQRGIKAIIGIIYWSPQRAGFMMTGYPLMPGSRDRDLEVIGNRWDDPELYESLTHRPAGKEFYR